VFLAHNSRQTHSRRIQFYQHFSKQNLQLKSKLKMEGGGERIKHENLKTGKEERKLRIKQQKCQPFAEAFC